MAAKTKEETLWERHERIRSNIEQARLVYESLGWGMNRSEDEDGGDDEGEEWKKLGRAGVADDGMLLDERSVMMLSIQVMKQGLLQLLSPGNTPAGANG